MMTRFRLPLAMLLCLTLSLTSAVQAQEKKEVPKKVEIPPVGKVAQYLQDCSVTVRAGPYSGSGVMVQTTDGQVWIWTAGHVVEVLRETHVTETDNGKRTKVEFRDAKIQRFHKDKGEGRIVSTFLADAEVIRYSNPDRGHDLALLRLRDKDFKPENSARFYLDKDIPEIGEDLYHCGSLLGPIGSNSLTSGIMSQHGRVFDGKIYDQTTATSFPGSSGGIVCLKKDGRYVGMLVMGAGEGFGLIVPVRRMHKWAKEQGVDFAMDPSKPVPTDEELRKKPIDDTGASAVDGNCCKDRNKVGVKFMVQNDRDPLSQTLNTLKEWFARPGLRWKQEDKVVEPLMIPAPVVVPVVPYQYGPKN